MSCQKTIASPYAADSDILAALTAEGRKSVKPMAAVTTPARVSVLHQKLLHFVGE
jgi:hypothetical protein